MKSIKFFAVASAVALLSTAGFTSCNQKNGPDGPEVYNGETVKTEFSIAIPDLPESNSGVLRMPSATVQTSVSEFNGIKGITLIPFSKQGTILSTDNRLGTNIELGEFTTSNYTATTARAKYYENVSIPLSTASFLFYGESAKTGDNFIKGSLSPSTTLESATPGGITFSLEVIQSDESALTAAANKGGKLLAYLTSIATATDGASTPKAWYQYTATDDAALAAMFTTFTAGGTQSKGMHGLSTFEVERVVSDLYTSLKPLYDSNNLAKGICDAINNSDYVTEITSTSAGTPPVVKYTVVLKDDLQNFPESYNIPQGSIDIKWVGSTTNAFTVGDYTQMAHPNTFVYPSSLWYYTNSVISTSNNSQKDKYVAGKTWDDILGYHTDADAVNTRTRAVAIDKVIQYGVARLDVTVKLENSSLADNSKHATGIATAVNCGSGFPVTAILVGNQKNVGFDFTPKGDDVFTIYDKEMSSQHATPSAEMIASTTPSAVNSTLVLETGTGESNDVNVAIEMVNTSGVDFYGLDDQLIPAGGKFYVVGKLTAASATDAALVAAEKAGHVFAQDFTTTANFKLKDLKKAYNTIPDLRTPKLELGFSVDLTWQAGHTYDINIGGE